jgi:hypothetical protein
MLALSSTREECHCVSPAMLSSKTQGKGFVPSATCPFMESTSSIEQNQFIPITSPARTVVKF